MNFRPDRNRTYDVSDETAQRILAEVKRRVAEKRQLQPTVVPENPKAEKIRQYWRDILGD